VTNQQFLTFLKSKKLKTNDMLPWYFITSKYSRITEGNYSTLIEQGYSEHPVVNVSWFGAKAYCEWAGANLPTEAQWEKAARGTTKQKYPWGNEKPNLKLANYGEIIKDTTPVGKYIDNKSPYGVFDLAGNVWEWVADWFSSDYYRNSPYRNPIGPTFRGTRVIRGGSFYCGSNKLRVTYRGQADPNYQTNDCGFRCVFNI
jgi:formylglycine-generating enzyme required for sulfatase activity